MVLLFGFIIETYWDYKMSGKIIDFKQYKKQKFEQLHPDKDYELQEKIRKNEEKLKGIVGVCPKCRKYGTLVQHGMWDLLEGLLWVRCKYCGFIAKGGKTQEESINNFKKGIYP